MRGDEHRAQLLMAAASGEPLDPAEQAQLERLLAEDPTAHQDLADVSAALGALPAAGTSRWGWDDSMPPADLEDRVLAATADPDGSASRSRWRPALVAACAAGLLALGGAGGWWIGELEAGSATGPPGTLGALEPVEFTGEPVGVEIDASVVAHTWGTETLFDVTGLEPGSTYQVVVVGADGTELLAGSFLATDGTVVCTMNAAVLRGQAEAIAIRGPAGADVLRAELPPVEVTAATAHG